jgi:hypothetical protein
VVEVVGVAAVAAAVEVMKMVTMMITCLSSTLVMKTGDGFVTTAAERKGREGEGGGGGGVWVFKGTHVWGVGWLY